MRFCQLAAALAVGLVAGWVARRPPDLAVGNPTISVNRPADAGGHRRETVTLSVRSVTGPGWEADYPVPADDRAPIWKITTPDGVLYVADELSAASPGRPSLAE
jgi:hypothetical protein